MLLQHFLILDIGNLAVLRYQTYFTTFLIYVLSSLYRDILYPIFDYLRIWLLSALKVRLMTFLAQYIASVF